MKMKNLALAVAFAATWSAPGWAQDPGAGLDEAVGLFARTCMAHYFSGADLHARFDNSAGAVRYDAAEAVPFLAGKPGVVWGIRGHASNYAVALVDTQICSLSAQSAVPGVWDDFGTLLTRLFPNAELVPVSQEVAGPLTEQTKSKGYRLRAKGTLLPPIFTMMTNTDPAVNFADRMTIYFPANTTWPPKPPPQG